MGLRAFRRPSPATFLHPVNWAGYYQGVYQWQRTIAADDESCHAHVGRIFGTDKEALYMRFGWGEFACKEITKGAGVERTKGDECLNRWGVGGNKRAVQYI